MGNTQHHIRPWIDGGTNGVWSGGPGPHDQALRFTREQLAKAWGISACKGTPRPDAGTEVISIQHVRADT